MKAMTRSMQRGVRRLARVPSRRIVRLTPRKLRARLAQLRSSGRFQRDAVETFVLDENITADAYVLTTQDGNTGPAVSVFFGETELLRIDGLRQAPHLHYSVYASRATAGSDRVALPPASPPALIDRIHFELANNLGFALHMDPRRPVRRYRLDDARVLRTADAVREHLLSLVPSLPVEETR